MSVADNHELENTSQIVKFLKALFTYTEQPIFLQTLANDSGDADEAANKRHLLSRDIGAITRFVAKHDRARRGMFCCVATVKEGARTRSKETVHEIVALHQDLDFKGIVEPEPAIWEAIGRLECRPSIEVRSGGGVHLYWLLREPLPAVEYQDRVEIALKALAEIVAGDISTCEISRLMRLPGTHNSKYGDMREVVLERCEPGLTYELEDLEDWIDRQQAVLERKPTVAKVASSEARTETEQNPFLRLASQMGYKPRLDVEQALAAMDKGNIHDTQVRVSASLIHGGREVEEVVAILMEATRRQVNSEGWNWQAEERSIRRACEGALKKFPPRQDDAVVEEALATVTDLGAARAARAVKATTSRAGKVNHLDVGEIFLSGLAASGQALMFTENQGAWRYVDGLWRLQDNFTLRAWLDGQIEQCIRGTSAKSQMRLVNETRAWIIRHPDLQAKHIDFDAWGQVPTRSGLVDPLTGEISEPRPEHYSTWRIECDYDAVAQCPWWLTMLSDAFADRPDDVRVEYVDLLQEMLGAGLIDRRPRALSKALIFQGGSNAGKSGLLEVMGGLFSVAPNTASLDTLDGPHGLVPFSRRAPWVLHEAFEQRKWHFSSIVKAIITGEPVQINVKNGPMLSVRFTAPVLWGTNGPPQFQEASKAIVNRIVVVKCWQEFDEGRPIGAAVEALRLGLGRPASLVLGREMPGLLAWAVAGLRRALARGYFDIPAEAMEVAHEIRLSSNLVAGFVEDCVDFDMNNRVTTSDFCAAFSAWWAEHKGENRSIPSNESIGRALAALGDNRIAINPKELRDKFRRYYAGIRLNDDGLRYWNIAVSSDLFKGKTTSASAAGQPINSEIPNVWDDKKSVFAMRLAHSKRGDRKG